MSPPAPPPRLVSLAAVLLAAALGFACHAGVSSARQEAPADRSGEFVFAQGTPNGLGSDDLGALYTIEADGKRLRRVVPQCVDCAANPRWSPDGSKIAYAGNGRNLDFGLVVMNADGSEKRLVCNYCLDQPAWSADGRRIALWDEKGLRIIDSISGRVERQVLPWMRRPQPSDLDWSPDGRELAFDDDAPGQRIYVVNSNGTGLHLLTRGRDPRWSPDGETLLFMRANDRPYLLARHGGRAAPLRLFPPKQRVRGAAAWSADGREIAYFGLHGIHVFDLDTHTDRQISIPSGICTGAHYCFDLDWQRR